MNRRFFLFFVVLLVSTFTYAQQNDPVVIKVNNKPVYKSELEQAYRKDNPAGTVIDKKSLNNFVQSYIDFRLNVEEARAQKLDTTASYKREYSSYKMQLSNSISKDTVSDDKYIQNIYNRYLENIEINHILLPFDKSQVFPADTLALYRKALELRGELLKKGFIGEGFSGKALPTSITRDVELTNGYLGWIQPFMLSVAVENAAYTLPVGEISMPIRTVKGYHIIEVLDRRPAKNPVNVDQVVFNFPNIPATQHQIDSVGSFARREYANIQTTGDFQSLCDEFAEVFQTGDKGCELGVVGLDSQLPPSFIAAAMALEKTGDVSEPVMTDYGFHIIRLGGKIPMPEFSSIKKPLMQRILGADRADALNAEKRKDLSEKFNLSVNFVVYESLKNVANYVSPLDSAFIPQINNEDDILFTIGGGRRNYSVSDFLNYLEARMELTQPDPNELRIIQEVGGVKYNLSTDNLEDLFNSFVYRSLLNYADFTLEERNPEFRREMESFADGILLFAVKNRNVWEKAEKDEQGLSAFFNDNKAKYALGGTKYKGVVIYCKDAETLEKVEELAKNETNREALIQLLRSSLNADSVTVQFEPGLWVEGNNPFVDNKIFGGDMPTPRKGYPFFIVVGRFINQPEDFTDVRNAVENDYQEQLDKKWITYLRNKYKVEIDQSVLKTIK